ncbi:MAG: winged helix-turn-helix domain-containing protein [Halobacteriota archaeon]|nr:winged helix-turn-helix domain-containing protein [Halobacteriota archaeon]
MQSEFNKIHEKSSDWLRLLARSEIRINILRILKERSMKLSGLRDDMNLTSSTILHAMKDMEDEGLIVNTEEGYTLTNIGRVQAILIADLIKAISVLTKNKDFWLSHDISGIPDYLLKRLGDLNGCEVVKSTTTDLFKPHSNFVGILSNSKEVKGVSPIFYREYPEIIERLVKKNVNVNTVVTNEVLSFLRTGGYKPRFEDLLKKENFRLWVMEEEIKVAFTVTDSFFSFGLFRKDGTYDVTTDLTSQRSGAIKWGNDLYEYYCKKSNRYTFKDF